MLPSLPADVLLIIGEYVHLLGILQLRFVCKRLSTVYPKYPDNAPEQRARASYCFYMIIQSGSLSLVQWAMEVGLDPCPGWYMHHTGIALQYGHLHLIRILEAQTIKHIGSDNKTYDAGPLVVRLAEQNRVDSIEWLFNNGFDRWLFDAYRPAVTRGHYYMIQVLHRLIGRDCEVMEQAIQGGFFKIIKWLSLHDYQYKPTDRDAVLGKWGFDLDTKDWASVY
jgi:hypothetical protein